MKKIITISAILLLVIGAFSGKAVAQDEKPNRVLVVKPNGEYKSSVIDNIDRVQFMTIEGPVLAEVEIFDIGLDFLTVSIIRTPECYSYSMAILPTAVADEMDDFELLTYVEEDGSDRYYQDFITDPNEPEYAATVSGIELEPDTDYEFITVGYDSWNIAAGVGRYGFNTNGVVTRKNKKMNSRFEFPQIERPQFKVTKK